MAYETRAAEKLSHIGPALLAWYDAHARALPWRVSPAHGRRAEIPDPYRVWLSEIMLQQTTAASVAARFDAFLRRWPNVEALAEARADDVFGAWAGLGYYARARNLHKCARVVARDHGGKFPSTEEELKKLPGVGDYTAAAIAAIAFDKPAVVVDGNVERVVARLFAVKTPLPAAKPVIKARAAEIWPPARSGDFAQGLMDLGALICKPKTPSCAQCPLSNVCVAYAAGAAEKLPKKRRKEPKPERVGAVFVLKNRRGQFLFERRPEKGLLGGMLGLPGGSWKPSGDPKPKAHAPAKTRWRRIGRIEHVFTHFRLTLDIYAGEAPEGFRRAARQTWIAPKAARLPTVMKKAVDLARDKWRGV